MNPLYTRHFSLDEFSATEQARLFKSSELIVGLGGLGHLAATYLSTAGVGRLLLNDFDKVDATNLQRQFLYTQNDIGVNKATSACTKLAQLNADVQLDVLDKRLSQDELVSFSKNIDLILDCSDNFGTRFSINRAAVHNHIPLVSGAAIRFEGQITTFKTDADLPCYQCLFEENGERAESCAGNGILAPVTGVIASAMAVEALKILTHIGSPLLGRLQLYNGKTSSWKEVQYTKDPNCEVCSL